MRLTRHACARRLTVATLLLSVTLLAACGESDDDAQSAAAASATPTGTVTRTATSFPEPTVPAATATGTATHRASASATRTATATATITSTPPPTNTATPTTTPTPTTPRTPTITPGTQLDLSHAQAASFVAHSSVLQLYITDAVPNTELALTHLNGVVVRSAIVDDQGTLVFRDLTGDESYVAVQDSGGTLTASAPVPVWAAEEPRDNSFYASQHVDAGYGYITTRDGTKLALNVILPGPVEEGPYPTVIEYSGYDPANPDSPQPSMLLSSALGYAVVGVNVRGSGCSGGSFQAFEVTQDTDGYDAVEIIAQQPWVQFNKVGMVGISYPAIMQLFTAQLQPPHLAAIAPLSVISDTIRGNLFPGGIFNNGFSKNWTLDRQHDALPFGQDWSKKRRDEGDQVCIDNQKLRGQTPNLLALINQNQYYNPVVIDPISPITFVHKITAPVFLAGAWQDEQTGGYFPNMIAQFTGASQAHFTITNGGHTESLGPAIFSRWIEFLSLYVRREIPHVPGQAQLLVNVIGQTAYGVDHGLKVEPDRFTHVTSYAAALAQFESDARVRVLFENGTGGQVGAPVAGFERSFDTWPPPETQPTIWYFDAGGTLSATPPTGDGADSYVYDPAHGQTTSHPDGGSDVWVALPKWNWRPLDAGKAVAYATDPLPTTLVMTGPGSIDLWLKSTTVDTEVQVTLSEIRPDGKESYIQNGWLRVAGREVDPTVSTILRPVQTYLEKDVGYLTPGAFVEARVELFPFAHVFRAGSRIRVSVESPGGDRPSWKFDSLPADGTVINTIGHSIAAPSRVVLPVLPGIEVTKPLGPCTALRGQPCRDYVELSNTPG